MKATCFLRFACLLGLVAVGSSSCGKNEETASPAPAFPDVTIRVVVSGTGNDAADASRPLPAVVVGTTSYRSCYTPGSSCNPSTRLVDQRTLVDGISTFPLGKLKPGTVLYLTAFFQRPAQRPLTNTSQVVLSVLVDGQAGLNQSLGFRDVNSADAYTSADNTADLIKEATFVIP